MTQNDARAPEARPPFPDPESVKLKKDASHRYLHDAEFHHRVDIAHRAVMASADGGNEAIPLSVGALAGAMLALHIADLDQPLAEVGCPTCGTVIRAKMADAESDRNALLASVLRKLIADGKDIGNNVDLGYRHYRENGRIRENPQLPYFALEGVDADLTPEEYAAVQDELS